MATNPPVLEDGSLLSRLDRLLLRVEVFFAMISGLSVMGLMFLAVVSAGGRNFFKPLPGYIDWIEIAMPFIAIFAVSYCQRNGAHIRMDLVIGRLRGRALWMMEWVTTSIMLVFMALMTWGSWAHFQRSFDWGVEYWSRDSTVDIGIPIWPAKLVVPVAFATITLRLCLHLWGYGRALIKNPARPVAVPLIVDVVTQAAQEADSVSHGAFGDK